MRTFLSCILFLVVLSGCSEKEEVPALAKGTVIISGKVSNRGEESSTIRFAAQSVVESIEQTAIIESDGTFRLEIELYHPQNIQGFFKNDMFILFLRPADSLYLEIDEAVFAREDFPAFRISGTSPAAEISQEIMQYQRYRGQITFDPRAEGKSVEEYLDVLNNEIIRRDSLLQSFSRTNKTSDEFISWAEKHIRYDVGNYLLIYKFTHRDYDGGLFDESIFQIEDEAIISSLYPMHLRHYALNAGMWEDSISMRLLMENNNLEANRRSLGKIMETVQNGLSRDIMCYKLLLGVLRQSHKDYEVLSPSNDEYIENPVLKAVLQEKADDYRRQNLIDIAFLDPETKKERDISGEFWKELKEKHEGEVVYVDIWATWCAPCRSELPHALELHEYFNGKDVAFVNLCLASNKNDWQELIEEGNIKGENYFFNQAQTQIFQEKLKFPGYPTYMIIDQQGNIVTKNAPRPSSGEKIKNLLNEWIEKKKP